MANPEIKSFEEMFTNEETTTSIGANIEDIIDDSAHEANREITRGVQEAIMRESEKQFKVGKKISPNWHSAMSEGGMHLFIPFGEENIPVSVPPLPPKELDPLYYYQKEALEILKLLVQDKFYHKDKNHYRELIINLPCGAGKTRIFLELLAWWEEFNVSVVVAPTITLLRQLENDTKNFMKERNKDFNYAVVCSDSDLDPNAFEYEEDMDILARMENHGPATTKVNEISNIISSSEKPLIIFSTYASLTKVGIAALGLNIELDLLVADEAHRMSDAKARPNLLQENLPIKYKSFFTATVRSKKSNRVVDLDCPMNNRELFGPTAYQKTPSKLIEDGFILPVKWVEATWNEKYYKIIETRTDLTAQEKQEFVLFVCSLVYVYQKTGRIKNIAFVPSIKNSANWYYDNFKLLQKIINAVAGKDINLKPYVISQAVIGTDRTKMLKSFETDENAILFNYQVIKEGIDIQSCNSISWMRKMDGVGIVQSLGRAMRKDSSDKTKEWGYVLCPMTDNGRRDTAAYVRRMRAVTGDLIEYGYEDIIIGDPLRENPHETTNEWAPRPPIDIDGMTMKQYHELYNAAEMTEGEFHVNKRYTLTAMEQATVDEIFG